MRSKILVAVLAAGLAFAAVSVQATPTTSTEVADAALSGDTEAVRALLRRGADVNAAHADGMSALHWAALSGDTELAKMLVYAGATLRASTRLGGYTPLLLAAERGDEAMIATLLEAGADPTAGTTAGAKPLMLAAASGRVEAVRALLEAGAEVDGVESAHGQTALVFAAAANRASVVEALLSGGADPSITTRVVDSVKLEKATRAAYRRRAELQKLAKSTDEDEQEDKGSDDSAPGEGSAETEGAESGVEQDSEAGDDAASASEAKLATVATEKAAAGSQIATKSVNHDSAEAAAQLGLAEASRRELASQENAAEDLELAAEAERKAETKDRKPCVPYMGEDEESESGSAQGDSSALLAEPTFELSADELRVARAEPDEADEDSDRKSQDESGEDRDPKDESEEDEEARPCPMTFGQLVGKQGGMTALHHAARQGHLEAVRALLDGGADVNQVTGGDHTSPLLIAILNGRFDLAMFLLERGADPRLASRAGATPLYAVLNVHWAPHAFYPQPSAAQENTSHLDLLQALLDHGADPNARLTKKLWYTGYNFDQSGVDESGATAFFRAAQAGDVPAMRLLVAAGADPSIATLVVPERRLPNGRNADVDLDADPPELGSPAVSPLQVASGAGYVGNYHRIAASGFLPAVRYLVEELGADVNAVDHRGYSPLHNAAARGDNEMIRYLVSKGGDVTAMTRDGMSTADLANGPVQRIQPFPETIELLVSLGAVNNDRCVSC